MYHIVYMAEYILGAILDFYMYFRPVIFNKDMLKI